MTRLSIRTSCAAALLLLCLPTLALAQRELHWDTLLVTAHLDADGALSVVEDQTIVFTGDWNGGERTFDIRPLETLSFEGMSRWVDSSWRPMTRSSGLRHIDEFAFTDAKTLRWRSRLPSDPPFDHTSMRYQLRYTLSRTVKRDGGIYMLDRAFAFPDRNGVIEHYELRLTFDPAWRPGVDIPDVYTADALAPGRGFVLAIPLRYTGTGAPVVQDGSRPSEVKMGLAEIAALMLISIVWFFASEYRKGRFARIDIAGIDEAWLREHVLKYPAELVSAAWDDNIGQAEVVALLARLTSEGKLESRASGTSMTLRLLVPRGKLDGYERALIDKLFYGGRTTTSTDEVKSHYTSSGFNPVDVIKPGLAKHLKEALPFAAAPRSYGYETLVVILIALGMLTPGCLSGTLPVPFFFVLPIGALLVAGLASIPGLIFRRHMEWGPRAALVCLIVPCAVAAAVAAFLWFPVGTGEVALSGMTILGVAALGLVPSLTGINALRSRQRREGIALRKQLTAGRLFFKSELAKPTPALRDEWFPWVLAFNLGKRMDDWSAKHASDGASTIVTSSSSSSSSHSSSSSWTGFGGGHSGGAGASATWAAAAGGIAAGVASPSSSSSGGGGGGGGGGGSSGGGGGGGW
jgi:uncharacterized membrane protein YgcG